MKILVGMSGGLDSSYSARILLQAGHTVEGAFLSMFPSSSAEAAERSAKELGIPLHIIDCAEAFERYVKAPFAECYRRGLTPNPCVECNRYVKIRTLCDFARNNGFDRAATGHYGRVTVSENGRYCVVRSENEKKDQSYMLWGLTQEELSLLCLPLSNADKENVRRDAGNAGLSSASGKESMDICFLPQGGYDRFVEERLGPCPPGNFVDRDGNVLGRHKGIIRYTVGQRKHLGIALGQPMFVCAVNAGDNTVTLAPAGAEYSLDADAEALNFQASEPRDEGEGEFTVKLRYAQKPMPVHVTFEGGIAHMRFDTPVRAVTPGQSAVFYDGDRLAFGGYIKA